MEISFGAISLLFFKEANRQNGDIISWQVYCDLHATVRGFGTGDISEAFKRADVLAKSRLLQKAK